jgi:hypothetical protein
MLKRRLSSAAALLALVAFAGCGGGGRGGTSNPPAGSGTLGVYVTDAFNDDFSQVWVTLYKIELGNNGTGFQTVFEDSAGKLINVAALRNTAELLAHVSVPAAGFNQARVTIGDQVTLVPTAGGAGSTVPVDDSVGTHANGKVSIDFTANTTISPGQLGKLIVDFDLANFQLVSGKVRPHLRRGDDNQFNLGAKHAEVEGNVSNLVAGSGFDLQLRGGQMVHVIINGDTVIWNHHAGTVATLANGQKVQVKGSVDATTLTVTATSVRVEDRRGGGGDDEAGPEAEGTITSIDAATKSFVIRLEEAEHITPGGSVTIKTDATTVFDKRHFDGAVSFSDLATGQRVEATGTFDAATRTLTAKRVEIR